jgi:signal transduction histidine kinase
MNTWALADQDGNLLLYTSQQTRETQASVRHLDMLYPDAQALLDGNYGQLDVDDYVLVYDTVYPLGPESEHFWVIIRSTPRSIIFADIIAFHRTAAIFYAGTILTALALALYASDYIATPISQLKQAVESFGRGGHFAWSNSLIPADEIGALIKAFDSMASELEKKRRQQQHLIEKLIHAQEEERKLVAYDLHDGLLQQMIGARYHLQRCQRNCLPHENGHPTSLERSCDVLSDAIVEGRRIIEGLHPTVLDDFGLVAALRELAESLASAAEWQLQLDLPQLAVEPDRILSVTVYRIAQEALNNARKHAQATQVAVSLANHNGLNLVIRDNGQGFNPLSLTGAESGLGLTTMHERATLVDGQCRITSQPGTGTEVKVWIPWREEILAE